MQVISRDSMMQPILSVSPSFEPVWREFLAEWQGDPDGLPVYLALSDLARRIAALFDRGAESELREIFEIVEAWHLNGDPYVKEAATVGLIEDLQIRAVSQVLGRRMRNKSNSRSGYAGHWRCLAVGLLVWLDGNVEAVMAGHN